MKQHIVRFSTAAFGLLLPVTTLAVEYSPSEQVMMYATNEYNQSLTKLEQLQRQLKYTLQMRDDQETEYFNSFDALHVIREGLIAERALLEDWQREQIAEENNLLNLLQVQGAPHNVLKIRAKQRQLANAKKLFAEQRDIQLAKLEEKEEEWQQQWNQLEESQKMFRKVVGTKEQQIRDEIAAVEFQLAKIDHMRDTGRILKETRPEREALAARRDAAHKAKKTRLANNLKTALQTAKETNYFNTPNEEVVAQLLQEREEKIAEEQAMQMKMIIERLGITGPVDDSLRASLYLHLFGNVPQPVAETVEQE